MKYCPRLRISQIGGNFRILSTEKLSEEKIFALRDLGLLGYGQEFKILSHCDGTEVINPIETVPSLLGPAYADIKFFVYNVVDLVDSSG